MQERKHPRREGWKVFGNYWPTGLNDGGSMPGHDDMMIGVPCGVGDHLDHHSSPQGPPGST